MAQNPQNNPQEKEREDEKKEKINLLEATCYKFLSQVPKDKGYLKKNNQRI